MPNLGPAATISLRPSAREEEVICVTWYVTVLELDVVSLGEKAEEALANLKEALELHFEPPQATRPPDIRVIEVEVGAA